MRKLDGDTKNIIDLYKYDKEKEILKLISNRKKQIRDDINNYIEEQKSEYLFFNTAIANIREKYNGKIGINYSFEISNYQSDFESLFDEDAILRALNDSYTEIKEERKNLMLALQFADSKSKEYKEALKKLEKGY